MIFQSNFFLYQLLRVIFWLRIYALTLGSLSFVFRILIKSMCWKHGEKIALLENISNSFFWFVDIGGATQVVSTTYKQEFIIFLIFLKYVLIIVKTMHKKWPVRMI